MWNFALGELCQKGLSPTSLAGSILTPHKQQCINNADVRNQAGWNSIFPLTSDICPTTSALFPMDFIPSPQHPFQLLFP